MSELMWITSHVEQLLESEWGVCRVGADDDGDYFFRNGTAACWVTVMACEPTMVRVFAHAAYGLKPSLKLLRELNDIQRRTISCRVDLADDLVLVSQTINPIGLTRPVLAQALSCVSGVADDIGALLAVMFDGQTPFDAEVTDSEDASG